MWKNRIRAGNPACMGVTKTGRDVNFAVAVKDQKSCSLLLYRKGTDEPIWRYLCYAAGRISGAGI